MPLSLMLFAAGLQVPVRYLGHLLRAPTTLLLAGLALHLAIPRVPRPVTDGRSGLITTMILIVTMPVAIGATAWTGRGDGDGDHGGPSSSPSPVLATRHTPSTVK